VVVLVFCSVFIVVSVLFVAVVGVFAMICLMLNRFVAVLGLVLPLGEQGFCRFA
jgi:hypothetical protein